MYFCLIIIMMMMMMIIYIVLNRQYLGVKLGTHLLLTSAHSRLGGHTCHTCWLIP